MKKGRMSWLALLPVVIIFLLCCTATPAVVLAVEEGVEGEAITGIEYEAVEEAPPVRTPIAVRTPQVKPPVEEKWIPFEEERKDW